MSASTVIVDYGLGNVGSVVSMGRKAGHRLLVSNSPGDILSAKKLILPGVGAFQHGMANLHKHGLVNVLHEAVLNRGTPILGICLGMQLFGGQSEEGDGKGLGFLPAHTERFRLASGNGQLRIPHMGWNQITPAKLDPLLENLPPDPRFYFVHSFHLICDVSSDVMTWTEYGYPFASGIRRNNIWGVQFHPEKSHKYGLAVIRNFLSMV